MDAVFILRGKGYLNENIKVSIIVPVYNVEEYLRQCLDSLINQTLNEIEIICVNDGSTDNSLKILEEYQQENSRIKIINKKNEGLGAARNSGMEHAKGDYIGFVDSDDWVDLTMFEKLYNNAKKYNSDIVMCPIYSSDDNKESDNNFSYFNLECFNEDYDNIVFDNTKTKKFIFRICVTAFNKIYRNNFLKKINAKFPEGVIFEDNPFFYKTFLNANKITLIRDFLYFYRAKRPNSIISNANKNYFDVIKIHKISRNILFSEDKFQDLKYDFLNYQIGSIFYRYYQVSDDHKKEFFDLIKIDFQDMNLKNFEINKLNPNSKHKYLDILNSSSYKEFELLEKIRLIESTYNKKSNYEKQNCKKNLNKQKKLYEKKLKSKEQIIFRITCSNSWKFTKPLRKLGNLLRSLK